MSLSLEQTDPRNVKAHAPTEKNSSAFPEELVVWQFRDGKKGHESQSDGLLSALGRQTRIVTHQFEAGDCRHSFWAWLLRRFPPGRRLPAPDLIIGAGHRTHGPVLAARRSCGGRIVLLMRPTLPLSWFDFAVIPEHDAPPERDRVLSTRGVLNPIEAASRPDPLKGLILLGGPSRHHDWADDQIIEQLKPILAAAPEVGWTLTNSRRTPETALSALKSLECESLTIVPHQQTASGWVAARLAECGRVWVSEDSISMIFEALTAGAQVGLLRVPAKPEEMRVMAAVEQLKEEGRVAVVADSKVTPASNPIRLAEADRVADWLLENLHGSSGK